MANRFWVGGNANWDATAGTKWATTSGGAGGAAVPTAADDVFLDNGTGTGNVTIAANVVCRSLNCTSYVGILTYDTSARTLTIGDATAGASNIALKLVAGMTYTALGAGNTITFTSSSATTQTVDAAGKSMPSAVWQSGCDMQLTGTWASISTSTTWTFNTAVIRTNGQTVTIGTWTASAVATRTFTLGSSTINLTAGGTAWDVTGGTVTLNANTSTLNFTGAAVTVAMGGKTYNNVNFTGSGAVTLGSSWTCANLTRTGTAIQTDTMVLNSAGTYTITGVLTLTGNSTVNRLLINSNSLGTARNINAASVSLTNVDFQDINGLGEATWSGTSVGDFWGNTNITFTQNSGTTNGQGGVFRYWVGGTGNTNSTTHWSETSGGSTGASLPLPHDTVVVDGNSGTGTITNSLPRLCRDLDMSAAGAFTVSLSLGTTVAGSFTLSNAMSNWTNSVTLAGRSTHTITTAGKTVATSGSLTLQGPSGTYTLQDNLTTGNFTFNDGTFNSNDKIINATNFTSTSTRNRTASWGQSNIFLSGTTSVISISNWSGSVGAFNAGTSTWYITDTSATNKTITPGGSNIHFYNVNISGGSGSGTIVMNTGSGQTWNIDGTLTIGAPKTITFHAGFTYGIDNLSISGGTATSLVTLQSDSAGSTWTISGPNVVGVDYLSLKDSTATGTGIWYAGRHSVNVSNNNGWIFGDQPSPVTLTLAGQSIKTPNSLKEITDNQYTQNRVLQGSIKRKYFGSSKRAWELTYENLNQADYTKIKTIYDNYIATNSLITLELTGTAYDLLDVNVHMDMEQVQFPPSGINYLTSFTIVLREA